MVFVYIVLALITIFSSFTETLGSEETKILDDILTEMNQILSMKREMDPPTLPRQPSVCTSYTNITDSWRHIDYVNRGRFPYHCDTTDSDNGQNTNLGWGSWFRFTGAAGTKLPTAPAPGGRSPWFFGNQICGTGAVAWLKGGNPTIQEGIVTRDVCFEWGSDSCIDKTRVGVAACRDIHGDYFVYQLQPLPAPCNDAYCAID